MMQQVDTAATFSDDLLQLFAKLSDSQYPGRLRNGQNVSRHGKHTFVSDVVHDSFLFKPFFFVDFSCSSTFFSSGSDQPADVTAPPLPPSSRGTLEASNPLQNISPRAAAHSERAGGNRSERKCSVPEGSDFILRLQLYFGGFIPLNTWNAATVSDGVTGRRHLEQRLAVDQGL